MAQSCPVCQGQLVRDPTRMPTADLILEYDCPNCGRFAMAEPEIGMHLSSDAQRAESHPHRLAALLREQSIRGPKPYFLQFSPDDPGHWEGYYPIKAEELLRRWPATVQERLDRALCNLARLSKQLGQETRIFETEGAVLFAESKDEVFSIGEWLKRQGVVDGMLSTAGFDGSLTPDGWARFHELTRGGSSPENPVFVAMWLAGAEMREVYDKGIYPAVRGAGYNVGRVVDVEHNEWIMDQVLGMIRTAPFVVAEFTGHRNGVYFEAGFARGLGITVVNCCKESELSKAHFDTRQLNHVTWNTVEELRDRLRNRILGTIGQGPHPLTEQ